MYYLDNWGLVIFLCFAINISSLWTYKYKNTSTSLAVSQISPFAFVSHRPKFCSS